MGDKEIITSADIAALADKVTVESRRYRKALEEESFARDQRRGAQLGYELACRRFDVAIENFNRQVKAALTSDK